MKLNNIQHYFVTKQADEEVVCKLCDGQHGNNAMCQATMEVSYEIL